MTDTEGDNIEPMPDDHFAEIEARHAVATDGPYVSYNTEDAWSLHVKGFPFQILKAPKRHPTLAEYWPDQTDSEFLTHSWADMRDMIAERKRLLIENAELSERATLLSAMEAAGVDNWEGMSVAYEIQDQWREEDHA